MTIRAHLVLHYSWGFGMPPVLADLQRHASIRAPRVVEPSSSSP